MATKTQPGASIADDPQYWLYMAHDLLVHVQDHLQGTSAMIGEYLGGTDEGYRLRRLAREFEERHHIGDCGHPGETVQPETD